MLLCSSNFQLDTIVLNHADLCIMALNVPNKNAAANSSRYILTEHFNSHCKNNLTMSDEWVKTTSADLVYHYFYCEVPDSDYYALGKILLHCGFYSLPVNNIASFAVLKFV
jgi:hypothetical protein